MMRGMLNPLHIICWYRQRFLVAYFDQRTSDSEQIEIWKAPRHTRLRDYIRRWEWDWQLGGGLWKGDPCLFSLKRVLRYIEIKHNFAIVFASLLLLPLSSVPHFSFILTTNLCPTYFHPNVELSHETVLLSCSDRTLILKLVLQLTL